MSHNLKLRLGLFLTAFGLLMAGYVYRLIQLQVVSAQTAASSTGTYTYDTRVTAARGEILDRNGNVLISNRASYNLIITGYALFNSDNPNESLRQLVNLCRELPVLQEGYRYFTGRKAASKNCSEGLLKHKKKSCLRAALNYI